MCGDTGGGRDLTPHLVECVVPRKENPSSGFLEGDRSSSNEIGTSTSVGPYVPHPSGDRLGVTWEVASLQGGEKA